MTTLMVYAGAIAGAADTRTGGAPLVPIGFDWPRCRRCGWFMRFLAQVRLVDVDDADPGLYSVFMCQHHPGLCNEWDATGGGNLAFVFRPDRLEPAAVPTGADALLPETSAVAYVPMDCDDYDEARQRWAREHGRPIRDVLGQLGGTPAWIQRDEAPTCGGCDRPMAFVVQLEEGHDHRTAINFGGGCGYGFRCRRCSRAAFLWQR